MQLTLFIVLIIFKPAEKLEYQNGLISTFGRVVPVLPIFLSNLVFFLQDQEMLSRTRALLKFSRIY
jgi:hypothetical protein